MKLKNKIQDFFNKISFWEIPVFLFSKIATGKTWHYSYLKLPMKASLINIINIKLNNTSKYAIVIQGPLSLEYDFTLETVRIYKKIMPGAIIIVSTWKGQDKKTIDLLKKENVHVLENDFPESSGYCNMNYQVTSSINGINKAKELGAEYVLKNRSDQRIYRINACDLFIDLLKKFPVRSDSARMRIIALGNRQGGVFSSFYVPDYFYFGHIDDIIKLFSINGGESVTIAAERIKIQQEIKTRREIYENDSHVECRFVKNYIKVNENIEYLPCDIYTFWEKTRDYFIFLSNNDVSLIWNKYERSTRPLHDWYGRDYRKHIPPYYNYNFDLLNWIGFHDGLYSYDEAYEKFQDDLPKK